MKNLFLVFVSLLSLTACSTSVNSTFTSKGNPGYRLVCGGMFGDGDMGSCYQKAGELCQASGYRIMQTSVSSMIIECREDAPSDSAPSH
jgi:hypothetical protein